MAYQELYNYTGKNAVKMAGTLTQFSIDGGTNWLDLQGFQEIGTVGTKANTIDQSTIEDQTKRFISGIKEGEDKAFHGEDHCQGRAVVLFAGGLTGFDRASDFAFRAFAGRNEEEPVRAESGAGLCLKGRRIRQLLQSVGRG